MQNFKSMPRLLNFYQFFQSVGVFSYYSETPQSNLLIFEIPSRFCLLNTWLKFQLDTMIFKFFIKFDNRWGFFVHISETTWPILLIYELNLYFCILYTCAKFGADRTSRLGCILSQTDGRTDRQTDRRTRWLHKPWLGLKMCSLDAGKYYSTVRLTHSLRIHMLIVIIVVFIAKSICKIVKESK